MLVIKKRKFPQTKNFQGYGETTVMTSYKQSYDKHIKNNGNIFLHQTK